MGATSSSVASGGRVRELHQKALIAMGAVKVPNGETWESQTGNLTVTRAPAPAPAADASDAASTASSVRGKKPAKGAASKKRR